MSGADDNETGTHRPVAFISHHSSQVLTARHLKEVLGRSDIVGWMAPDDIDPGRAFDQAITQQIRNSDLIILLFCARSDQSRHVKRELMMAENADKLIYPVRLEDIAAEGLAYWLNDYQWIDWIDRRDATIARMIEIIKRQVKTKAPDNRISSTTAEPAPPIPPVSEPTDDDEDSEEAEEPVVAPEEEEPVAPLPLSPAPPAPTPPPPPPVTEPDAPVEEPQAKAPIMPVAAEPETETPVISPAGGDLPPDSSEPPSGFDKRLAGIAVLGLLLAAALFIILVMFMGGDTPEEQSALSSSVDCSDTSNAGHALICGSEALSAREAEIETQYQTLLGRTDGEARTEIEESQARFVVRRDACTAEACLTGAYDAQAAELTGLAEAAPAAAAEEPAEAIEPEPAPAEEQGPSVPPVAQPVPERAPPTVRPRPPERTPTPARPTPAPPASSGTASPPRPTGNPGGWVRQSDYPSEILTGGEQGTTRYRVSVNASGRPVNCFTTGTSGHWQLDARTCRRVMSRARFRPARDNNGNPTNGIYTGSHTWRAP